MTIKNEFLIKRLQQIVLVSKRKEDVAYSWEDLDKNALMKISQRAIVQETTFKEFIKDKFYCLENGLGDYLMGIYNHLVEKGHLKERKIESVSYIDNQNITKPTIINKTQLVVPISIIDKPPVEIVAKMLEVLPLVMEEMV